jgi:hypothetical protein
VEQGAGELLAEMTGNDFGVGRGEDVAQRAAARKRYEQWVAQNTQRLEWRENLRRFE